MNDVISRSEIMLVENLEPTMRNLITLILLTAAITLSSTTLTVKQDGSGDWTTIQSAVNASADGDTVLVWPGTYYENVNFNGYGITIASLELTDWR